VKIARLIYLVLALIWMMGAGATNGGTVTMDGSLPGTVSLSASTYSISSGKQSGINQFYSFSQLNLVKGDIASFSATSGVSNIFARVNGGQSSIDGTISAPSASFYLINNQGVIFGPDATLNVGGAFVVTTADELKFADGKVFTAAPSGSDATLSTAAPSAFGFLSASPQAITINGSTLSVLNQQPITVVGGNVTMNGGTLQSSAGRITVASVASAGTVTVNPTQANSTVSLSGFTSQGTVSLNDSATITTDGNQGGQIVIRSGQLLAVSSSISAQTTGNGNGAGIDVGLTGPLSLTVSNIITSTSGSGGGGNITLNAGSIVIDSQSLSPPPPNDNHGYGLLSESVEPASGPAGNISISTGSVFIENNGTISTATYGSGAAGNLMLTCSQLTMLSAFVTAGTDGQGAGGNVTVTVAGPATINAFGGSSGIFSNSFGAGNAGSVTVSAGSLTILDAGSISAYTASTGNGGELTVSVSGTATFDGTADAFSTQTTGLLSGSYQSKDPGGGNSGNIRLTCGSLIINDASIEAPTTGTGAGGDVNIAASGAIIMNGPNDKSDNFAEVANRTSYPNSGGGNAGSVTVTCQSLVLNNLAEISSSTEGTGAGGNVSVTASGDIKVNGGGIGGDSGIFANSFDSDAGVGGAGSVTVSAASLELRDVGEIGSSAGSTGSAGSVTVSVSGPVTLDGIVTADATQSTGLLAASTDSNPGGGKAGIVTLTCGSLVMSDYASIEAYTSSTGAGGDVNITVNGAIIMNGPADSEDNFAEVANRSYYTGLDGGNAGSVAITCQSLEMNNCAEISATTFGTGAGGNVNVKVSGDAEIDAGGNGGDCGILANSLDPGTSGSVTVSAASLTVLDAGQIGASATSTGNAGDVNVTVTGAVTLDGSTDPANFTGLLAETTYPNSGGGNAGNVMLTCGSLSTRDAQIEARSKGTGAAGGVSINVSGLISITDSSSIAVSASLSNGGDLSINRAQNVIILNSSISATAQGTGGSIVIDPPQFVVIRQSAITANADRGNGGSIQIAATDGIFSSTDSVFTVASVRGIPGTITLASPPLDLTGALIGFPQTLADLSTQLAPTCSVFADTSTLIESSYNSLPPQPGGWTPIVTGEPTEKSGNGLRR
jgi:filamentous hemagglutinin family protein